jgi:hypothetical protein
VLEIREIIARFSREYLLASMASAFLEAIFPPEEEPRA